MLTIATNIVVSVAFLSRLQLVLTLGNLDQSACRHPLSDGLSYWQEAQLLIFLGYLNQNNKYTVNKSPLILHAMESKDGNNAKLLAASPFFSTGTKYYFVFFCSKKLSFISQDHDKSHDSVMHERRNSFDDHRHAFPSPSSLSSSPTNNQRVRIKVCFLCSIDTD